MVFQLGHLDCRDGFSYSGTCEMERQTMPQTCTICRDKQRREIDEALLRGEPYRSIAKRTGTSTAALARHKQGHIPASLARLEEAKDVEYAGSVFERLKTINRETVAILREARSAETPIIALMAV